MKNIVKFLLGSPLNQEAKKKYRHICIRTTSVILFFGILNLTTGCHYYRSATFANKKPFIKKMEEQLTKHKNKEKYFVVHQGEKLWHLRNTTVNQKDKTIVGTFEEVDSIHMYYIDLIQKVKKAPYKKINEADVLSQVHLYVSECAESENNTKIILFTSIKKIDVYYQPKGPIASIFFIPLGSLTLALLIFIIVGFS